MIDYQDARKIADMLAAVGEPTRMLILHRLAEGPTFVGQLADTVGVPIVNMSHHLGVMRQAGLLDDAKDGRRVVYSLRPDVYAAGGAKDAIGVLTFGAYKLYLLRSGGDVAKPAPVKPAPPPAPVKPAPVKPAQPPTPAVAGKKAVPGRKKPTS
ncbi:MAG: ArsR/SmtB family transcription factor [Fimbriiglobus sp.]